MTSSKSSSKSSRLIATVCSALALGSVIVATSQPTQPGRYGLFSGQSDIGIGFPGATVFDPYTRVFKITGGGADLWGTTDAFHLAWVKLQGDAAISADVEFPDHVPSPLAKAVLIFRQNLEPNSPYADVAIHADGHVTLQYREAPGGPTADVVAPQHNSKRIRIERRGNVFAASALSETGRMIPFAAYTLPMKGPVFVGIGVCAHDVKNSTTVRFSNVSIERLGN